MARSKQHQPLQQDQEPFSPESFREWAKDPRGALFWETLREKVNDGFSRLRALARLGDGVKSAYEAGLVDAAEEIMTDFVDRIVEEQKKEGGK